jgi:hypothetical protein
MILFQINKIAQLNTKIDSLTKENTSLQSEIRYQQDQIAQLKDKLQITEALTSEKRLTILKSQSPSSLSPSDQLSLLRYSFTIYHSDENTQLRMLLKTSAPFQTLEKLYASLLLSKAHNSSIDKDSELISKLLGEEAVNKVTKTEQENQELKLTVQNLVTVVREVSGK